MAAPIALFSIGIAQVGFAQIVPDATLPNSSAVTTDGDIRIINGGTQAGSNLFHSFEQFSVQTGGTAFFDNALSIQNIITRVTGSSISTIDGLIQANGTANLFLLNPNGIVFGENAQLNIGGSFLATTASSIFFADGTQFSATQPTPPLLTINVPIGLQLGANPGAIRVEGRGHNLTTDENEAVIITDKPVGLAVQPGKTIALLGGEITLEGGNLTAPSGRVELSSVQNSSSISINSTENGFTLGYEQVPTFADIRLSDAASIDVSGEGAGEIQVQGRQVLLEDGSTLLAVTEGSLPGGSIAVNASESLELLGITEAGFRSSVRSQTQAEGKAGDLQINTRQLLLEGGEISASTFSAGNAGSIEILASESIEVINLETDDFFVAGIAAIANPGSTGNAGNIFLETGRLRVQDGAQISSATFAEGRGGDLTVRATQSVELVDASVEGFGSSLATQTQGSGRGGNLFVETGQLSISGGAVISTSTLDAGDAGDILIQARDFVEVSGSFESFFSGIYAQVDFQETESGEVIPATGNGGNLTIETPFLNVRDGGFISAASLSEGRGGRLSIAANRVEVSGTTFDGFPSGITTATTGSQEAGDLIINTEQLIIQGGAGISASTFGDGRGGNLEVTASEVEVVGTGELLPSRLTARTQGRGNAGDLRITAERLNVEAGAEVNVSSTLPEDADIAIEELGNAGNLEARVENVQLDAGGVLTAETESGQGGNIFLFSRDLRLLNNSRISTTAGTQDRPGDGGNITIRTDTIVGLGNSDISANAFNGSGGVIDIETEGIFGIEERSRQDLEAIEGPDLTGFDPSDLSSNDITAISRTDPTLSGTIAIQTPDIDPTSGLVELEDQPIDAAINLDPCTEGAETELINTGRGGLPPTPNDAFTGQAVWEDWRNLEVEENQQSSNESIQPSRRGGVEISPIIEAQNWTIDAEGELVLTAPKLAVPLSNPLKTPANCSPSQSKTLPETLETTQFQVNDFEIVGSTVFSTQKLAKLTERYKKQPIHFNDLRQLRTDISKLYEEEGYITTGAFIPEQTTQNRVVKIQVVEGSLADIKVTTSGRLNPNYVASRIQRVATTPVRRQELIEALQLLQLDPRIERLSAELSQGIQPGTSLLSVRVEEASAFNTQLTLDNNRSPSVGSFRQQIQTSYANLLGLGDVARFAYTNTEGSDDWEIGYTIPVNSLDGTVRFRFSTGDSRVIEAPFDEIDIEADSRTYELSYRQPLLQEIKPKGRQTAGRINYVFREFALGLTATRRESQTSILGVNYPLSPGANEDGETRLFALRFFQDWTQRDNSQVFAARSEFSLGLGLGDATINESEPDSQFFAWRGQAQWVRRFSEDTLLLVRGDLQLSANSLLPFEQFSLGGQQSIRGYRQDALLTDSGAFASIEMRLPIVRFGQQQGLIQIAPFVDVGTSWNFGDRTSPNPNTLVSTGLGLRMQLGERLRANLDWGIPLIEVNSRERSLQENGIYFSVIWNPF
nr:filamentous hemagglutinin N-terminal domain-containing protein [Oscillatoria laete-virens]